MPYADPDPTDPTMLVGVILPGGTEAIRDMAYVFAEEFARMGLDDAAILGLFQNAFYAGAHQAYRALGADEIRTIVSECVAVWGRAAGTVREVPPAPGPEVMRLPDPVSRKAGRRGERPGATASTGLRGE